MAVALYRFSQGAGTLIAVFEAPDVLAPEHLDYVEHAVVSYWRNQQMDMADYQDIGTQDTIVLLAGLIECLQKESTVFGGIKDRLAVVPADDDMLWMSSQNETGLPSHADNLLEGISLNQSSLTPLIIDAQGAAG